MRPIITRNTTDPSGVETLCTFSINIQKKYLKDIHGMIGRISFENPENKEITVLVGKFVYCVTRDSFVDFSVPQTASTVTRGQLLQTVASGTYDIRTHEKFPSFCNGNVLSNYLNTSRIDGLELVGLSDDAPITLECYTIMKACDGCPSMPLWTTYSFSC
jgi:hypothetical protein